MNLSKHPQDATINIKETSMGNFEQASSAVFNQGKKDAFLGSQRAQQMDEVWRPDYESGFTDGERLRNAAQEVDFYRLQLGSA